MGILRYDSDSDSMYVNISSKKAYLSVELSDRVSVDLSESKKVVGVEMLDASKVISDLFQSKVSKSDIKNLLCKVSGDEEIYLNFELKGQHKRASLLIPAVYESPIVSA